MFDFLIIIIIIIIVVVVVVVVVSSNQLGARAWFAIMQIGV